MDWGDRVGSFIRRVGLTPVAWQVVTGGVSLSANSEVGGTAWAAISGSADPRRILGGIGLIQAQRSSMACADKHRNASGTLNLGIGVKFRGSHFSRFEVAHHAVLWPASSDGPEGAVFSLGPLLGGAAINDPL